MNEPTTQNDEYVYIFFYAAPKHTDVCFVWNCHVGPFQVKISAMSTKQEFSIAALYLSKRFFLWMVFTDRNFCLFISYEQQHAVLYDTCLKSYLIF